VVASGEDKGRGSARRVVSRRYSVARRVTASLGDPPGRSTVRRHWVRSGRARPSSGSRFALCRLVPAARIWTTSRTSNRGSGGRRERGSVCLKLLPPLPRRHPSHPVPLLPTSSWGPAPSTTHPWFRSASVDDDSLVPHCVPACQPGEIFPPSPYSATRGQRGSLRRDKAGSAARC